MVDDDHGVRRRFQQSPKFLFRFLAFGNVANGAHCQRALLGLEGAETDFHGKFRAILSQAVQLQPRAHGARTRFGEKARAVAGMFAAKTLGHQHLDFLANEFFAGVTEELLGLRIHQDDLPPAIDNDDGVRRGLQQSPKLLFGFFAFGNVANGAHRQRALLGLQRAETDFHREFDAILAPAVKLQPRAHRASARLGKIVRAMSHVAAAIALWQQHFDGLAAQFDAVVTEESFGLAVR